MNGNAPVSRPPRTEPEPSGLRRVLLAPGEWLFAVLAGSRQVPGSRGTFLVSYHRWRGGAVALPGDRPVRRGDLVAEIHFWNWRIAARQGGDARDVTWRFIRDLRADLRALAGAMASGRLPLAPVYGASPLAEASARFGFAVRPLAPGWRRNALTAWQTLLRRSFHPAKVRPASHPPTAELWMGAAELLRRYGPRTEEPVPGARNGPPSDGGPRPSARGAHR